MADNSVLLHKLEPKINKALSSPSTVKQLETLIANYVDRNIEKLSTIGPVYRTLFLDDEFNKFYNVLNISPEEVKLILKESTYIKGQWQIMNNPFNSIITFCIRHFGIKKNEKMMNACVIYFTLSFYPSLHTKYFKYEPNKAIMDYTIENLSNKYKVKNTDTFYQALIETTMLCNQTYLKNIIKGTDKDITDYVHAYKTRLNSLIKKIAIAFYENESKGAYFNETEDSNDPDDFRSTENDSIIIEQIANSVVLKLATEGPDMKLITLSAKACGISVNELRNTCFNLCADNNNRTDVRFLVSSLIYIFIFENHKKREAVSSNDFYFFCMDVYGQANTTNKNVIKIKVILDKWLNMYSAHYRKTNRVGTLNNFRRALYTFMVFTIQQTSKQ
jgi:hypothetical protein